ncbi:amidase, hydantoinase/carbamoylase family [Terriglobus roseus DSM 18391]|uniref:Amidase, hydantoinase/carbamoylase family n=1 Tax=Terriglobus roseus (strain DSM 18391 / NRRL B-41598 / KBS 63) TaxID=926566 RepID=I3ZD70_TERRK|nr:M20 family metallo-hydrolase [Terriglobus roseus]AFL87188.1 amidase, hydantoinase/carbamoylase family [Terriglobus roseus DSM 18391]
MNLPVDTAKLQNEMDTLAGFTQVEQTGRKGERAVTRVVFTDDDMRARAWLKSLYEDAGLAVREDAVGNTFARWIGSEPDLPAVGTGSHTDAIPHAGMYDGTLGVLGGLEAIRAMQRAGVKPRRSIELVMFTSEEPTRFGIGCLGSRLLAGTLDPARADALLDKDELPLRQVREAAGFAGDLTQVKLPADYYSAWAELHIEQGPLLECDGLQIGVVTHIAAPASYRFTIEGFGGHAGALLMPHRRDALCAAAEIILAVEHAALATAAIDTVATVGTVKVHPGAVNSVPSRVDLELDVRDTDPDRRDTVMAQVRKAIADVQERRGVTVREEEVNADAPATSSRAIVASIEKACESLGLSHRRMVSRAYHDSLFVARIAPVAMIFVPCRGGVSHRPDEFATVEAMTDGVRVLAETLRDLAG